MKHVILSLLIASLACRAADETDAVLKNITKGLSRGDQEALTPLKDHHNEKAAELVLSIIGSGRIGGGIKARVAEIVAEWPALALGRKTLLEWLTKHPNCEEDELLFYASIRLPETRSFFWSIIEQQKAVPTKWRQSLRIAMAVKGLGAFEDNPEPVVKRVAGLLAADMPHVIRACAVDALGGMKHAEAVAALIPHIADMAIGPQAVRSLYRLTGQHFDQDPAKQWSEWHAAHLGKIEFKMHKRIDFENFLKMQALIKPVDDTLMNANTFYGLDVKGKGLLFILDVSGSMDQDNRINKLRGQMTNILTILQSRSNKLRYGIVTFGDQVEPCFGRGIAENSPENARKATRFVDGLKADGGTPMVEVLEYAFNRVLPDANIDSIYFLSDGSPSDGTPEMVLDITRKIHQRFQVRVNTISIGEAVPAAVGERSLLQKMAELSGGSFTQPK